MNINWNFKFDNCKYESDCIIPEKKLTINTLSGSDKSPVIPPGLQVSTDNNYSITASEIESFAAGTKTGKVFIN